MSLKLEEISEELKRDCVDTYITVGKYAGDCGYLMCYDWDTGYQFFSREGQDPAIAAAEMWAEIKAARKRYAQQERDRIFAERALGHDCAYAAVAEE